MNTAELIKVGKFYKHLIRTELIALLLNSYDLETDYKRVVLLLKNIVDPNPKYLRYKEINQREFLNQYVEYSPSEKEVASFLENVEYTNKINSETPPYKITRMPSSNLKVEKLTTEYKKVD